MLTYEDVKNNSAVRTYIQKGGRVSDRSGLYGAQLCPRDGGGGERRLYPLHPGVSGADGGAGKIAGFLHDIGNLVNRVDHSQSGAVMAFRILDNMDCPPEEIATIVTAIRQPRRGHRHAGERRGGGTDPGGQVRRPPQPGPESGYGQLRHP